MKSFENWLERIAVLRQAVTERERKMKVITANKMGETIKMIMERMETRNQNNPTTQLVKPRNPLIWSGQKFEKWRLEIEKWSENNKSTDEDKYGDLMESLKKNDVIKEFVTKTLVEKIGTTRTV